MEEQCVNMQIISTFADNGSDHQLVMAGIKIKLRKLQAIAGTVGRRYNAERRDS